MSMDEKFWFPSREEAQLRLEDILSRGSLLLGKEANIERLMLMITRSCELRCSYCFVQKTETGLVMNRKTAQKSVDLLMSSQATKLEVQFFGGEPIREWELLLFIIQYAYEHPLRGERRIEFVLTSNGILLNEHQIAILSSYPVVVLFSLDGDREVHRRFRQGFLCDDDEAYKGILQSLLWLRGSKLNWFMNATIPPKGADRVFERYLWARKYGVQRLQLNYSVGHYWKEEQEKRYLLGLQKVLHHHAAHLAGLVLFNWKSLCEPVMLSNDLIVDVEESVLHDAAIFLERSLPNIRAVYFRGMLDSVQEFDPLRLSLRELYDRLLWGHKDDERATRIIKQNCLMGACVDLVAEHVANLYREPVS